VSSLQTWKAREVALELVVVEQQGERLVDVYR
jgi:hypothetical protein